MATRREQIIRHITKSSQQGNPSLRAIRHWNHLPDQRRFGADPVTLRKHLQRVLPSGYSVPEDLTIGVPHHKRKGGPRGPENNPDKEWGAGSPKNV